MPIRHSIYAIAVLLFAASQAIARAPATKLTCASAAGIKTEAEITYIPSQKISAMDVTFMAKRPPNKEIDRVVRDCLAVAIKRDGSKDILASAWFRKRVTDNSNDDDQLHPWGSLKFMSYTAATKTVAVRDLTLSKKK